MSQERHEQSKRKTLWNKDESEVKAPLQNAVANISTTISFFANVLQLGLLSERTLRYFSPKGLIRKRLLI